MYNVNVAIENGAREIEIVSDCERFLPTNAGSETKTSIAV